VVCIRGKYVVWKFFLLFPVYKVIKPIVKLPRMIRGDLREEISLGGVQQAYAMKVQRERSGC